MLLLFLELHCGGMISTKNNVVSTMLPPDTTPLRLLISSFLFIIATTLMRDSYQTSSSDGSPITSQVPFEIMKAPYIIQLFLWRCVTKKFRKLILLLCVRTEKISIVSRYIIKKTIKSFFCFMFYVCYSLTKERKEQPECHKIYTKNCLK